MHGKTLGICPFPLRDRQAEQLYVTHLGRVRFVKESNIKIYEICEVCVMSKVLVGGQTINL